jgi:hypothetical protein
MWACLEWSVHGVFCGLQVELGKARDAHATSTAQLELWRNEAAELAQATAQLRQQIASLQDQVRADVRVHLLGLWRCTAGFAVDAGCQQAGQDPLGALTGQARCW